MDELLARLKEAEDWGAIEQAAFIRWQIRDTEITRENRLKREAAAERRANRKV